MKLLSNNPKRTGLIGYGLEIVDTVPIEVECNIHNEKYLSTKKREDGTQVEIVNLFTSKYIYHVFPYSI